MNNKIDHLKKQFEEEQLEISEFINQRIQWTLENLPDSNKKKLFFSSHTFKYVLSCIACLMLAYITIFPFISDQYQSGKNFSIPDGMRTVQNSSETFTTVMPDSWETMNLGEDQKHVITMTPQDQSVSIIVSDAVFYIMTGEGTENNRNILIENFETSDSYRDFVDKMVNHQSVNGNITIREIDKVNNTPVFMNKIDDYIMLMAYTVVDKKPFLISLQSFEANTLEKLKEEGYYQYFIQAIQLTRPN